MGSPDLPRYDPWHALARSWPQVEVVFESMSGNLLGQIRAAGRVIALRRESTPAQLRCTLAHELVHLERGFPGGHPFFDAREEALVHRVAARRLIRLADLACACQDTDDARSVATALDVDRFTLAVRLAQLTPAEIGNLRTHGLGHQVRAA